MQAEKKLSREVSEEFSPTLCLSGSLVTGGDMWKSEKNTPLECMINNFKKVFNGDYRVKLTPKKLKFLCEVD
jgi:hypothetical protein